MNRRDEVEKLIALCQRDKRTIKRNIRTPFDEELVFLLDQKINDLTEQLAHIDAAERVRRVLHES